MQNKKTIWKIFLVLNFVVLSSVAVFSQSTTTATTDPDTNPDSIIEVADQALKVEIIPLPQQYPSKNIGFRIKIKSEVDSGRVSIQWYYPIGYLKVIGNSKDSATVTANSEYTLDKYFSPIIVANEKTFMQSLTMGAKVIALTYEKNYTTITKSNFIIDSNFQLLPLTDEYRFAKTDTEVTKIVVNLIIAGGIMLIISLALGRFLAYINKDDTIR
jgi:hypothetical protein